MSVRVRMRIHTKERESNKDETVIEIHRIMVVGDI